METADNNIEIGARIEAVATDVDSTNEDVDLVFYTMLSGDTATEALRVHDDGNLTVAGDLTSSGGNITGNLDVGSGLDVTGSITCSSDLDIEGDIDMATGKKITWVDDNQYISGTDTGITIESDDTFVLNADNSATITTPLLNYKGTIPNLQVETTTTSHYVLLTMIAHRGGSVKGEGFQMKVDGGTMTISSDHSTSGTYDDTILTLSGGSIDSLRTVGIGGALTVSEGLDIEGDIDMATGKKITWVDDNQYISGTATGITIESDDTFVVNADTSMTVNTESTIFRHTNNADVTIRSDNTSNGLATLTMISDNGDDLGDGWQIKSSFGDLYFSSDHTTNETYDTEIMRLSNHETQSSRIVYMNSQLQVKENMKMEADKLLYWEDTSTYITGNTTGMTIESDDTLVINADTSITFNCGNITMSSLDVELLDISNKITIDRSSNLTNSVSDLLLLVSRSNGCLLYTSPSPRD